MKNKLIVSGVTALVLLIGVGIWTLGAQKAAAPENKVSPSQQSTKTETEIQTSPPNESTASSVTITYTASGFDKASYSVKAGNSVILVNSSSRTIEFSSDDHPTHRENPELNLPSLAPGQTTTFTPGKTGTWHIHDHLDASKTTSLVVTQ